jgi:hypothetical protein
MSGKNCITLTIVGLQKDAGDVEFKSFLNQLNLVRKALNETERITFQGDEKKNIAYFKVSNLSHESPAKIILEAVPYSIDTISSTKKLVDKFFLSLDEIDSGKMPGGFDYVALDAFKGMSKLIENKKIERLHISRNGGKKTQLNEFHAKIDLILGPDVSEFGSAKGRMEYLNLHGRANLFYIYPSHNLPKIKCLFRKKIRHDVINSIDKFVTVYGKKKFKPNITSYNPYEIVVDMIEIHPNIDQLPMLEDLIGISPNATGDKTSEDFVRGIRDEW